MSRMNLDDNRSYGLLLGPRTKLGSMGPITAATLTLPATAEPVVFVNAAACTINLPPSDPAVAGAAQKNQIFIFAQQNGAGTLTIQTSAGGAFAPAIAGAAGLPVRVICTGNPTANLGWVIW